MNKETILKYLKSEGNGDAYSLQLIDECIQEVKDIAYFKAVTKKFSLTHYPLTLLEANLQLSSQDLEAVMDGCEECMIVACTIGTMIDRQIKYYEHIDMARAVVFDAVSSCYVEECLEEYIESLQLGEHTFCFAPGYGDLSLEVNKSLSKILQIDRTLGVSINQGGLFVPMKTILGIVGIGKRTHKSCMNCIRRENCELRKDGQRCYVID